MNSDTPRVDAAEFDWTATCRGEAPDKPALVVDAEVAREIERDITDCNIAHDALLLNLEMADDELRRTCETLKEFRLALTNIHALCSVPLVSATRLALESIIVRVDDQAYYALEKAKALGTKQALVTNGEFAP